MAKGPTMPSKVRLGENSASALTKAPARSPSGSVASKTGRVIHGIESVNRAASAMINESPVRFARSAQ